MGALIWSKIGDLKRFASAQVLVNDGGLASSLYESGEVMHRGSITRQSTGMAGTAHSEARRQLSTVNDRRLWRES